MTRELYGNAIPAPLRWLGCFGIERRGCIRFRWGEFSISKGLAFSVDHDDSDHKHWSIHIRLLLVQAFIYLPMWLPHWDIKIGEMGESWGFSWPWGADWGNGDGIHLHWGYRCKILHMPWGWDWVRTSHLQPDMTWQHETQPTRLASRKLGVPEYFRELPKWEEVHPYRYFLRSGEVQERAATIQVSEMEWRWRAFKWSRWPRMIRRTVDVRFDGEVGERSGSWKGGTIGCSYELRPNETPLECLRRMEAERKF